MSDDQIVDPAGHGWPKHARACARVELPAALEAMKAATVRVRALRMIITASTELLGEPVDDLDDNERYPPQRIVSGYTRMGGATSPGRKR